MRLRVLDFGDVPSFVSLAIWHGVADAMRPGDDPILTLCNPIDPFVCVGFHQDAEREVDEAWCAANRVAVLRREAGGGAVWLDNDQLFVHFVFPAQLAAGPVGPLYARFVEPMVRAYRDVGVPAVHRPVNDIHVNGRKIGGAAMAEIGAARVFASMMLFDIDTTKIARALRVADEKFRDKLRGTLADSITSLRRELGAPPPRAAMIERLLSHLPATLGVEPQRDRTTEAERSAMSARCALLLSRAWTRRKGRRLVPDGVKIAAGVSLADGAHKAPGGLLRARLLARDGRIADLELSGDVTCFVSPYLPPEGEGAPQERMGDVSSGATEDVEASPIRPLRGQVPPPGEGREADDPLDSLALALVGTTLDPAALTAAADAAIAALRLDMPGVDAADVAAAIRAAVRDV